MNPWLMAGTPIMAMRRSRATRERYRKSIGWSSSVGWYPGVEGERRHSKVRRFAPDAPSLHGYWYGYREVTAVLLRGLPRQFGRLYVFRHMRQSLIADARRQGATGKLAGVIIWPTEYDTYALAVLIEPTLEDPEPVGA